MGLLFKIETHDALCQEKSPTAITTVVYQSKIVVRVGHVSSCGEHSDDDDDRVQDWLVVNVSRELD